MEIGDTIRIEDLELPYELIVYNHPTRREISVSIRRTPKNDSLVGDQFRDYKDYLTSAWQINAASDVGGDCTVGEIIEAFSNYTPSKDK